MPTQSNNKKVQHNNTRAYQLILLTIQQQQVKLSFCLQPFIYWSFCQKSIWRPLHTWGIRNKWLEYAKNLPAYMSLQKYSHCQQHDFATWVSNQIKIKQKIRAGNGRETGPARGILGVALQHWQVERGHIYHYHHLTVPRLQTAP